MKEVLLVCLIFWNYFTVKGQSNEFYQSKLADLGDINLQYMDFGGDGPTLIWIQDFHNYFDGAYRDTTYFRVFSELTEEFHVIAPIRRGYGESTDTEWGYEVASQSKDLLKLMDVLGIEKAIFFGRIPASQDMTWIAEHHPERVLGLVYDGNPILLAGCNDRSVIEFVENWSILAPDFEREKQKRIVLSRLSWQPHFLTDETIRLDIPALRFIDPDFNWPNPNLGVLESGSLALWVKEDIPDRAEEIAYLRALLQDSLRLDQLHQTLIECDYSEAMEMGMRRSFGNNLQTIYAEDIDFSKVGLVAYLRWKARHIRTFGELLRN